MFWGRIDVYAKRVGKEDAWDNLMRIESAQVAAELLAIAFGIPPTP